MEKKHMSRDSLSAVPEMQYSFSPCHSESVIIKSYSHANSEALAPNAMLQHSPAAEYV